MLPSGKGFRLVSYPRGIILIDSENSGFGHKTK